MHSSKRIQIKKFLPQEMWTQTHPLDIKLHEEEEIAKNTVRMSCFFKDESSPDFHEQPVQIPKTMSVAEAALFVYQVRCATKLTLSNR